MKIESNSSSINNLWNFNENKLCNVIDNQIKKNNEILFITTEENIDNIIKIYELISKLKQEILGSGLDEAFIQSIKITRTNGTIENIMRLFSQPQMKIVHQDNNNADDKEKEKGREKEREKVSELNEHGNGGNVLDNIKALNNKVEIALTKINTLEKELNVKLKYEVGSKT